MDASGLSWQQGGQTCGMDGAQVDAVKNFWTQFGVNVVDHHMHEEGATMHRQLLPAAIHNARSAPAFARGMGTSSVSCANQVACHPTRHRLLCLSVSLEVA